MKAFKALEEALDKRMMMGQLNGQASIDLDTTQYRQPTLRILARMLGGTDTTLGARLIKLEDMQAQQELPLKTFLLSFITAAATDWALGK